MPEFSDWLAVAQGVLKGGALPAGCLPPLPGRADAVPLPAPAGWGIVALIDAKHPGVAAESVRCAMECGATQLQLVGRDARVSRRWYGANGAIYPNIPHPNPSPKGEGLEVPSFKPLPFRGGVGVGDAGQNSAIGPGPLDCLIALQDALDPPYPPLHFDFGGGGDPTMIADLLERCSVNPALADVSFGFDPVTEQTAHDAAFISPDPEGVWAARMLATRFSIADLVKRGFPGPFFTADGRPYHEAGAAADLELGCTLAAAVLYARALMTAGWTAEKAFAAVDFCLPTTVDWLESAAKLKALTVLWLGLQQASGVASPQPPKIHAETSWPMLLRQNPETNILRNTLAAFGAVLGGCASLAVLPHTALLTTHDLAAARLALTLQHVLAEEAHLRRTLDPAAGSGAMEAATDRIASAAWVVLQSLEGTRAGLPVLVADLLDGALAARIAASAAAQTPRRILGVTDYADGLPIAEAVEAAPMLLPTRRWSSA